MLKPETSLQATARANEVVAKIAWIPDSKSRQKLASLLFDSWLHIRITGGAFPKATFGKAVELCLACAVARPLRPSAEDRQAAHRFVLSLFAQMGLTTPELQETPMPPQDLTLTSTDPLDITVVLPEGTTTSVAAPDPIVADLPTNLDELGHLARYHEGRAMYHAYESGRALRRARSFLPHGAWEDWLGANFPLSAEVARQRLQLVEWIGTRPGLLSMLGDLPVRKVRALFSAPEADLDELQATGTIGGLPIERVKAEPYDKLKKLVEQLNDKLDKTRERADTAEAEAKAAKDALAEQMLARRGGSKREVWLARIDECRAAIEQTVILKLEKLLDMAANEWPTMGAEERAQVQGLVEYLQARTRFEALAFLRDVAPSGERPHPAALADVLVKDRAAKAKHPLPERRIDADVEEQLQREGVSLADANPGGDADRARRPAEIPPTAALSNGRLIGVPYRSMMLETQAAQAVKYAEAAQEAQLVTLYKSLGVTGPKSRAAARELCAAVADAAKAAPAKAAPAKPEPPKPEAVDGAVRTLVAAAISGPPTPPPSLEDRITQLLAEGEEFLAIRLYQEVKGCTAAEARKQILARMVAGSGPVS